MFEFKDNIDKFGNDIELSQKKETIQTLIRAK